jgi:hypothetical protein
MRHQSGSEQGELATAVTQEPQLRAYDTMPPADAYSPAILAKQKRLIVHQAKNKSADYLKAV